VILLPILRLLRIPADSIHSFRANPSTHSDPFRPLIPF
jgi:hypothetical protein